jgi:hypothetical protein
MSQRFAVCGQPRENWREMQFVQIHVDKVEPGTGVRVISGRLRFDRSSAASRP